MSRGLWDTLGIEPTNDVAEIKRAYARRLKQVHPEDDPAGFQALREAYDRATQMARNGWAVPRPIATIEADDADDDDFDAEADDADGWWTEQPQRWRRPDTAGADGWADGAHDRWRRPEPGPSADGWRDREADRWSNAHDADAPAADIPDDLRLELEREREAAAAHSALCNQLAEIVRNPDGDPHEALSAMLRVLRSKGMDSLDAYGRTERWLALLVAGGGPVVDEMVEPLIHFFDWNKRPVGVDMSHAIPVLERRDAGIAIQRLERKMNPDHRAWRALRDKPDRATRLRARLIPDFAKRVLALLERIERDLPEAERRMNAEAVAFWRRHQAEPSLDPLLIWLTAVGPFLLGGATTLTGVFGLPDWPTFFALWTILTSGLLGGGLLHLYGVARPRLAWRASGPWDRPLWQRFGWAGGALLLPLIGGLLPPPVAGWGAVLLVPVALGLWGWARVTVSHLDQPGRPFDWGRYVTLIPALAWLLLQSRIVGAAPFVAALGAAVVLQTGADAVTDEIAHRPPAERRKLFAGLLGMIAVAAAALAAAGAGFASPAAAAGLVAVTALADRTLAWAREAPLFVARRVVLLVGWIGGLFVGAMLPLKHDLQIFTGLGLWLLAAAALNALPALLEPFLRSADKKRKPGALA